MIWLETLIELKFVNSSFSSRTKEILPCDGWTFHDLNLEAGRWGGSNELLHIYIYI